jgi:superfamily II DNA or RNA helicase
LKILPETKGKTFALVLTQHRLWGKIFVPYIIVREPNRKYFVLSECLSSYQSEDTLSILSHEEIEIVRIISEFSDRNLHKLFSRDKTVKDFLQNVTTERIESFIRPYIELRLIKCYYIARDEGVACFYPRSTMNTLHNDDRLNLSSETARPVFRFDRNPETSIYKLKIEVAGKVIDLLNSPVEILCNNPCLIRTGEKILCVSDIDGQKLKPFLKKEHVVIPEKSVVKYFKGFVLNAVNNFKVEGSGFEILHPEAEKMACLSLEYSLSGIPVLILSFDYSGTNITPDDSSASFTIFENKGGDFIFRKYSRNLPWENSCIENLESFGFYSDNRIHFYPQFEGGKKYEELYSMIEAVNRNYTDLIEAGFNIITVKLDRNYNLKPVKITISNQMVEDWFDLKAVITIGGWQIPFIRFKRNIMEGIREYELPDGSIAVLPESWFSKYHNIFEFGKITSDSFRIHKQHFSLLSEILDNNGIKGFKQLEKLLVPEKLPELPVPAGLNCQMRNYQTEGLRWLHWLQSSGLGGCLADDMGLGKTIQALALLQLNYETLKQQERPQKRDSLTLFDMPARKFTSLVIVPASLVYNWENEIRRFVPGMKTYCHKGVQRMKNASDFDCFDIIISSYHTVRQDIDILSLFNFHYIILDESQVIKNPASMIYKSVIRLKSDYKLVLTGTPIENSLTDLWTQLNFVNPGLLGNLSFFTREFARPIEKEKNDSKETKLRKIIQPFILRRTKEMVVRDLPPVTEQVVYCNMTEEQEKLYDQEKSAVRNSILNDIGKAGIEKSAIIVLQGLMKLRQISNHPSMAYDDYGSGSGKFDTVINDIENVIREEHKILVFSSFVMHLKLVAGELDKKNISYSMLTGASVNREKIINGFQNEASRKVFLISLKAGGVGLNLTAADYVFILDPWWNPAAEMQALSRAHRIGQYKSVFIYKYISTGTLEEKIVRLQERKSKLAEAFVHSNNPLKDIDINQILDIIG